MTMRVMTIRVMLVLLVLTVAAAWALGRSHAASRPDLEPELGTLESLRAAFEQGDVLERSYRVHGFIQTMGPAEVEAASALIEHFNPWLVDGELRGFMSAWAAFDAPGALRWGLSRPRPFRRQAAGAAIDGWAFHDPEAARAALASLDPKTAPPDLEDHLVAGWLSGGRHGEVVEYIESRPRGLHRQRYTNLLTIELMRESPEAVTRWAEAVAHDAPGDYKSTAFQKAAHTLASADPVYASSWIEPHLSEAYAEGVPRLIGRRWLELDPEAALTWLASLPPGSQDKALRTTLLVWLGEAPDDAEAWVREASPAAGLDVPIEVMLSRERHDPEATVEWALRLHDPAVRTVSVLRFARRWLRRDKKAARRWIEQSDLEPAMKSLLDRRRRGARDRADAVPAEPGAGKAGGP
jgi:hypothetical protein